MPLAIARSVDGVPIRLTDERWAHIVERHPALIGKHEEVLDVVEHPDKVLGGEEGELLAVRKTGTLYLVVAYREVDRQDGFIVTAYLTRRPARRPVVWKS